MKVLYYHQHFTTPQGASGTRSYWMARRLIECGHEVCMVCGSDVRAKTGLSGEFHQGVRHGKVDGISVIEIDLRYSNEDNLLRRALVFMRFAFRGTSIALRGDYDILFATSTPLTTAIPGIFARWLRRTPFVFEVRDLWPELPREMGAVTNPVVLFLLSFLEWAGYRSATRLIGLSPGIVDGIARRGINRDRISMIPNMASVSEYSGVKPCPRPDGVLETDLMAVFTGAHGIANGLDAVLDAAGELQQRGRDDIKLVLVGEGKEKPKLRTSADSRGLHSVIFLPPMDKPDLTRLLASADLGLQILADVPAFYYGTSPNKFFDYAATGLPILCNYPGWISELITSYRCGFAVSPNCPAAFADALETAADDRLALSSMGRRARTMAEKMFSRDDLTNQFATWLEGAVNGRAPRG